MEVTLYLPLTHSHFLFIGGDDSYGAKGRTSFVRRRRSTRTQSFNPVALCPNSSFFTCDHCDLEEITELDKDLLNTLVGCSMKRHPTQISGPKYNAIKTNIVTLKTHSLIIIMLS
jgi:hypothetical protein